MKYVVVKIDGDTVILKDLFQSQTIEVSTFFINGNTQQKCEQGDILSYDSNTRRFVKDEVASEIYKSSFIDTFDPKKHNVDDYKFIVILGGYNGISGINGNLKSGQCLFIPFIEREKKNKELPHHTYLYYSLSKYYFGFENNQAALLKTLAQSTVPDNILILLSSLGHVTFCNMTYNAGKIASFMVTEHISEDQTNTINTMCQSLDDKSFVIGIIYNNDGRMTFYGNDDKLDFTPKKAAEIIKKNIVFGSQKH